jgi:hypothetical protein
MRYVGLLAGIGLLLAVTATAVANTTVVEGITGTPGDWTYTYTLVNHEAAPIWDWAVWFPSNPGADAVTAGTANWDATNLATHGFFPEEYTAYWGCRVRDSAGADLAGPNAEPGYFGTWAGDYGSSNPGEYYTGDGYWDPAGAWLPLPDDPDNPDDVWPNVWRGTKDYGYPRDFWGWTGSGANVTTSYGIAPGATSTFTVHATGDLVAGPKSFSLNTTDYCFSFYDAYDDSDYRDFEASGTVIPEPVTMAGLILGIGCLARYVRRRKV